LETYSSFEDELDAIRIAIYEEIKDMTPEEEADYFMRKTKPILERLGICAIGGEIVRQPALKKEAVLSVGRAARL
jgi:hypothetical protein